MAHEITVPASEIKKLGSCIHYPRKLGDAVKTPLAVSD